MKYSTARSEERRVGTEERERRVSATQAEDGIRDGHVTGVQTCALPILRAAGNHTLWTASRTMSAYDRLLMSSEVHAKWTSSVNSGSFEAAPTSAAAEFRRR